jgi:CubicO group peptidase (beta-lactamase class C family)
VFTTGSITKQFTATSILVLEARGKLSLQDPITIDFEAIPEDKGGVTLHHLLTHTAGFPGAIGDDRERIGREAFVRCALATERLFPPCSRYEYSNVGYSLLAAVVERGSGESYEAFLHRNLFEPAGMHDTGYILPGWDPQRLAHGWTDDGGDWGTLVDRLIGEAGPGWNLSGNGGICSTVQDMFRWHRAPPGDAILPGSSRGGRAAELLEAITTEDAPWRRAFIERGFAPSILEARTP